MTRHVSDEALPDVAEGAGSGADRRHAVTCVSCAARVEEARAALALARRADVPEPSPLYWEAMRQDVGRRIVEEPERAPWRGWLAPVAAAAAAVAVVVFTTARTQAPSRPPEPTLSAWSALPPAEDDASLEVLEGLAVADAGIRDLDEGHGVGPFLAGLSDEDYQALADSLRRARLGGES